MLRGAQGKGKKLPASAVIGKERSIRFGGQSCKNAAKTSFDTLVEEMTREDLRDAERDALVKKHGHRVHNQHE